MKELSLTASSIEQELSLVEETSASSLPAVIPMVARTQLMRMFRDPYVLEEPERKDLVRQLRETVRLQPQVSELRVLLGMALCVDHDAQAALEEFRESVQLAPDSFIARLKFGEILMRLRICEPAAEETHHAALLAENPVQAELARRQAATIRTMQREGIERSGFTKVWSKLARLWERPARDEHGEATAVLSAQ